MTGARSGASLRELWGIDNNLNIANMDWAEFADAVDETACSAASCGFPVRQRPPAAM
jgi:uncharacterized protein DUF6924